MKSGIDEETERGQKEAEYCQELQEWAELELKASRKDVKQRNFLEKWKEVNKWVWEDASSFFLKKLCCCHLNLIAVSKPDFC